MVSRNNEIIAQILAMDDDELMEFIKGLKPETAEYLEVILEKAENRTLDQLMKYIKTQ